MNIIDEVKYLDECYFETMKREDERIILEANKHGLKFKEQ